MLQLVLIPEYKEKWLNFSMIYVDKGWDRKWSIQCLLNFFIRNKKTKKVIYVSLIFSIYCWFFTFTLKIWYELGFVCLDLLIVLWLVIEIFDIFGLLWECISVLLMHISLSIWLFFLFKCCAMPLFIYLFIYNCCYHYYYYSLFIFYNYYSGCC